MRQKLNLTMLLCTSECEDRKNSKFNFIFEAYEDILAVIEENKHMLQKT